MNRKVQDQISKGNIEITDSGIIFPVLKAAMSGMWCVRKNYDPWETVHNIITTEGATQMLNVMFHGTSATSPWYVGIYDASVTPAVGDTGAVVVSKYAECTEYTSTTRPEWNEAEASSGSITDSVVTEFTANATLSVTGAMLLDGSVKEADTDVLFSAANFSSAKPLESGDKLSVGYTIVIQDVSV